jgi:hypothetical protein
VQTGSKTQRGQTALDIALEEEYPEIVQELELSQTHSDYKDLDMNNPDFSELPSQELSFAGEISEKILSSDVG